LAKPRIRISSRLNHLGTKTLIGGTVEKYSPVQNDIRMQYYAKMLLGKNEKDFESAYGQFLNEMKVRGHDEEYKAYSDTPAGKITIQQMER
jgi:putative aldouronate transport system substrate-binding protein